MQQINFTRNLSRAEDTTIFLTIEQAKKKQFLIFIFFIFVLRLYFVLIKY